jgi:hypothetical protein
VARRGTGCAAQRDGHPRQNPAYRPATEKPCFAGLFYLVIRIRASPMHHTRPGEARDSRCGLTAIPLSMRNAARDLAERGRSDSCLLRGERPVADASWPAAVTPTRACHVSVAEVCRRFLKRAERRFRLDGDQASASSLMRRFVAPNPLMWRRDALTGDPDTLVTDRDRGHVAPNADGGDDTIRIGVDPRHSAAVATRDPH